MILNKLPRAGKPPGTVADLTLGSLFDGIGGFPYAGSFFGIEPLWASEILPQAVSVTMKHFPGMEHVGDLTKLNGGDLPPVDIITFGSPCQDLSTAGRRAGLDGERSSLFYEAIRIIDEMRCGTNGKYPKYAVWENVPGALSSGKPRGSDFRAVLEAFTKTEVPIPGSGGWANAGLYVRHGEGLAGGGGASVAWRVLNAQYHGVPQRRRRIFLIASFGAGCPGEILFVEKSLRGDTASCRQAGEGTTAYVEGRSGGADQGSANSACIGGITEMKPCTVAFAANQRDEVRDLGTYSGALQAQPGMKQTTFLAQELQGCDGSCTEACPDTCSACGTGSCLTPWDVQSRRIHSGDGQWPALYSAKGGGHGYAALAQNYGPCIWEPGKPGVSHNENGQGHTESGCTNCLNPWETQQSRVFSEGGVSPTLAGADGGGGRNPGGLVLRGESGGHPDTVAAFLKEPSANARSIGYSEEVSPTLKSTSPCLCRKLPEPEPSGPTAYGLCSKNSNSMLSSNPLSGIYKADTSRTLDQNGGNPSCNQGGLLVLEPIPESKFEASLVVLNDQGGESMSVEKSDLSPTLRCETHGHLPIVACRHCHGPYMGNGAVGVHQGQDGNVNISDAAYTLSTYGTASCRNAPLIAYIKPRNQERQTGASGFTSKGNGDCSLTNEYHCTLSQGGGQAGQGYPAVLVPCPDVHCNDETYIQPEATGTLVASGAGMSRPGGMASEPDLYVAYKRPVFALQGNMIGRQEQNGPMGSGVNEDVCFTVTATDVGGVAAVFNMQRSDTFSEEDVASTQSARQYKNATDLVCEANQLIDGPSGGDEKSTASDCDGPTACGQSEVSAVDCRNFNEFGDISGTLQSKGKSGYSLNYQNPVRIPDKAKYIVRRLTPTECERLQGYPDGWTKNGHDGKEISDTRRYQMLGNSVAIPCVVFVLGGIVFAEQTEGGQRLSDY